VTESASWNETPWCSAIGLPNATRSSAQSRAIPSARSEAPQQRAAMKRRSTRNHSFAPSFPHAVGVGHAAVAQDDLRMVVEVGVVEETGHAGELEARRVRLDDEERLVALDDREHDVEAGAPLARDEPFLAAQDPVVAVADGGGGHGAHVRTGPGLGHRPGLPVVAAEDRRDPAVALLGRKDLP